MEVVDWDKDHADLKWKTPETDGGAPITGYVIEYKVLFKLNHVSLLDINDRFYDKGVPWT